MGQGWGGSQSCARGWESRDGWPQGGEDAQVYSSTGRISGGRWERLEHPSGDAVLLLNSGKR